MTALAAPVDRWLVIGASGLVGGQLVRHLRTCDATVFGGARNVLGDATMSVDLSNRGDVDRVVAEVAPTIVVVASAWPYVDGCETDPARSHRDNVETVENVARALEGSDACIVFYSTDHVFDGNKSGVYVESDPVNPLSVYAKHKREVEELLLTRGRSLVVRTAWVFGEELRQKNFVYRVASIARAGTTLEVPERQTGAPTSTRWLAETTHALVEARTEGIVHATGHEAFTKAEWARTIAEALSLPMLNVVETDWKTAGQLAPRPVRVVLASERHPFEHPNVRDELRALAHVV